MSSENQQWNAYFLSSYSHEAPDPRRTMEDLQLTFSLGDRLEAKQNRNKKKQEKKQEDRDPPTFKVPELQNKPNFMIIII